MESLVNMFQSISTFSGCPPSVYTLLLESKVDASNHTNLCNTQGCWFAFLSVAGLMDNFKCTITDTATKTIVPIDQVNCTFRLWPSSAVMQSTAPLPSSPSSSSQSPVSASEPQPAESNLALVIGVAAAVVVILVGAFVFWRVRGRQSRHNDMPNDTFHTLQDPKQMSAHHHKHSTETSETLAEWSGSDDDMEMLAMWNLPSQQLVLQTKLAEGAFGDVWLATYLGENVAVKTLLKHRSSMKDVKVFIEEIKLMAKMADCPAIVQFVGVSFHRIIDIKLVTEFMGGGDLRSVLQASDDVSFPLLQKVECALRVADALVFLHTMDPKVIHRDLKSRNVLMDAEKGAKVTDFGVSREAIDEETLT
ncbi:hypothetical protein As57867_023261, partial [Aphanomyces stellatus]